MGDATTTGHTLTPRVLTLDGNACVELRVDREAGKFMIQRIDDIATVVVNDLGNAVVVSQHGVFTTLHTYQELMGEIEDRE
jgi:hypothetical protein